MHYAGCELTFPSYDSFRLILFGLHLNSYQIFNRIINLLLNFILAFFIKLILLLSDFAVKLVTALGFFEILFSVNLILFNIIFHEYLRYKYYIKKIIIINKINN